MGARVLVVDDDADIRQTVGMVLEEEGYEVQVAADGAAALALLRAGPPPALILLDLMMPVMNGWQFREAQTADETLAAIPVVVISADNRLREACPFGDNYLRKPVDIDALLSIVARVVG